MQFSVNYHSKWVREANEIRCPWNQLGSILDDLHENKTARLCVLIPAAANESEFDYDKFYSQLALVRPLVPSLTVQIPSFEFFKNVNDHLYSAFFSFPVTDWETFHAFIDIGVSDIWIDGPLCFQAKALEKAKANYDINLRVAPTVSSAYAIRKDTKVNSFYLRPEDLSQLPIDIVDFHTNSQDREDTLYSIYKRGNFLFDISNLVPGLPEKISNKAFDKNFANRRANCGQICQIPGRSCHYCTTYFSTLDKASKLISME